MYFDVETKGKVLVGGGFGENMCEPLEIITERRRRHRRCFLQS